MTLLVERSSRDRVAEERAEAQMMIESTLRIIVAMRRCAQGKWR
jgi:hypothetical protein